jgi:hypothetical protein
MKFKVEAVEWRGRRGAVEVQAKVVEVLKKSCGCG